MTKSRGIGRGTFYGPRIADIPGFNSWASMKQRCLDPNNYQFDRYGGRGITVHPDLMEFKGFLRELGPRPDGLTLDRIDNERGYEPGNVRWAAPRDQRMNQRRQDVCVNGHDRTAPGATRLDADGAERCVECRRATKREWIRRKRAVSKNRV